jgi:hypothetical protein
VLNALKFQCSDCSTESTESTESNRIQDRFDSIISESCNSDSVRFDSQGW